MRTALLRWSVSLAAAIGLTGCQQTPTVLQNQHDWGVTSQIRVPNVFDKERERGSLQTASNPVYASNVFDHAQSVYPILFRDTQDSRSASNTDRSSDGYTLIFYDFYGVSFGYVTSVTRANIPLTPGRLLQRYDPKARIPEDQRQWQDATYVSGANTRRTPIGHYFHGYPVLYGLFSEASKAMGFRVTEVERLIMPSGNAYWALTKDGRYFDLLQRTWVNPTIVDRAKQEYDTILKHIEKDQVFERNAIDLWQQVENTVSVKPSACPASGVACVRPVSESLRSQTLEYPSDSQRCRPTYFMWWQTGFECDYSANRGYLPANLEISYSQDNDQKFYLNAYTGCGPTTLANMLWWWQTYKGYLGLLRPAISGYDSFGATQIELITDTNAYVDGIGRSATGGDVSEGLEKYLQRNYPALKSNAVMGWGATEAGRFHQVLVEQMSANNIVGIGHYVVNVAGHFGIMKQFTKIPFGGLTASLIRPPHPVFGNMNLSEFFSFSSVHWITRRY